MKFRFDFKLILMILGRVLLLNIRYEKLYLLPFNKIFIQFSSYEAIAKLPANSSSRTAILNLLLTLTLAMLTK